MRNSQLADASVREFFAATLVAPVKFFDIGHDGRRAPQQAHQCEDSDPFANSSGCAAAPKDSQGTDKKTGLLPSLNSHAAPLFCYRNAHSTAFVVAYCQNQRVETRAVPRLPRRGPLAPLEHTEGAFL